MRHPEAGNDGEPLPHRRLKKQGEEIIYPKSSDVRAALNSGGDKATLRDRHQSREGEIRNMPNPLPPLFSIPQVDLVLAEPAVHQAGQRGWVTDSLKASS